jgi:molybdate transport system ATP-binding protein
VLVARAFACAAPVLLLDEVFNGLYSKTRDKLRRALEAPRAGHTWVLTTHRPKELPCNVTHVAYIEQGRIVRTCAAGGRPFPNRCIGTYEWRGAQDARERPPRRSAGEGTKKISMRSLAGERTGTTRRPSSSAASPGHRAAVPLVHLSNVDLYRDYRPVIRNLNWTIAAGEHWAILGANGSGKSTLLSVLYGDLHPALGGTIERAGMAVGSRIEEWKQRVGWVSPELQADHAFAKSIEEIVISGRYSSVGLNEPPTAQDRRLARKWLQFFDIEALRERGPRQVSYGQMRLALFARAMINEPELLLLDEPCTGLDGEVREHVLAVLQRLAESGTQIVMAVHDPEDIVPAVRKVLRIDRRLATIDERGDERGDE